MKGVMGIFFLVLSVLSCARADDVSDAYNAGAGYAGSNKTQGTSSASGVDPSAVIPGYTASPSQSSFYGGVQGGDGGIGDKGLTELSQGEAGQAITDSSTKNPAVTIDPDAVFIQNGKNAEANAGSVMDGTNSQCTTKVVSKSVFENYSCDRDVNQVQTCARTGTPVASSHTETKNSQISLRLNNGVSDGNAVTFRLTASVSGTVSTGTISYSTPSNPGNHTGWDIVVSGLGGSAQLGFNSSKPYPVTPQHIEKGQTIIIKASSTASGHSSSFTDSIATYTTNGRDILEITMPIQESVTTTTTGISWSEACAFDKSQMTASLGSTCVDPGGDRTVNSNGQDYSVHSDCWQYSDSYIVPVQSEGSCTQLANNPDCTVVGRTCTDSEGITCLHESDTYQCQTTYTSSGLLCAGNYFCQTGDCSNTDGTGDSGFDTAVAKLAGLASAGDDAKSDQINVKAFTGQALYCRKAMAGFSNCCVDSGWGNSAGLANCNSDEMAIGKAKAKKVTVLVGEACNRAVLGVCVQKKQAYCVFGGKLARIIQEQGRRDQLHVSFGSGDSPDCRGITVPELQAINFDLINFQDFYSDLMANQKIPDSATMVKQAKDRIAAQVNAQTGGK
ncbi:type-F conjugative transfer system mating-pair stabilization protein TraN [Erwinia mallotivora]|uniref:type-F conjugative transfer system mating-pair stabilization protein TraN n=1 Tax=Erwinia mallotivora TaxID=69222 RepID=UPI0021C1CE92|nr:type-F conjugative transfer system mating-pair stabilization protein TraN [Erwinia mallotivora]